jgi:hypothetical protein
LLSRWFLARLILRPSRWRRYVPSKSRLNLYGLHGVISQKIVLFNLCCVLMTEIDKSKSIQVQISTDRSGLFLFQSYHSLTWTGRATVHRNVQTGYFRKLPGDFRRMPSSLIFEINMVNLFTYGLFTHLHLVPRSRMMELYLHSPICLHGVVLN